MQKIQISKTSEDVKKPQAYTTDLLWTKGEKQTMTQKGRKKRCSWPVDIKKKEDGHFPRSPVPLYFFLSALFHLLISFLWRCHSLTALLPSACLIHFVSSSYSLSYPASHSSCLLALVSFPLLNWGDARDCIVLNHWWLLSRIWKHVCHTHAYKCKLVAH